jgi:hypothetical protein
MCVLVGRSNQTGTRFNLKAAVVQTFVIQLLFLGSKA